AFDLRSLDKAAGYRRAISKADERFGIVTNWTGLSIVLGPAVVILVWQHCLVPPSASAPRATANRSADSRAQATCRPRCKSALSRCYGHLIPSATSYV